MPAPARPEEPPQEGQVSETTRCTGRYGLTNQHQCGCVESHSGECRPSNAWESCILRLIDERDASRAREERLRGALEEIAAGSPTRPWPHQTGCDCAWCHVRAKARAALSPGKEEQAAESASREDCGNDHGEGIASTIRALKPPEGPEGFEEWHARECPNRLSGVVSNLCGGGRDGEGSLTWNECFAGYLLAMRARPDLFGRYKNRTCREVYASEHPPQAEQAAGEGNEHGCPLGAERCLSCGGCECACGCKPKPPEPERGEGTINKVPGASRTPRVSDREPGRGVAVQPPPEGGGLPAPTGTNPPKEAARGEPLTVGWRCMHGEYPVCRECFPAWEKRIRAIPSLCPSCAGGDELLGAAGRAMSGAANAIAICRGSTGGVLPSVDLIDSLRGLVTRIDKHLGRAGRGEA